MTKNPYDNYPTYAHTVDYLTDANQDALFADGLEAACIGHTETWDPDGNRRPLVVYSKTKIVDLLCNDMSQEDAIEYAEYNIYNAYVGPNTPLFVEDYPL